MLHLFVCPVGQLTTTYLPEARIFFCWFHARQAIPEEWPRKVLKGASSPTLSSEVDTSQCILFQMRRHLPKMMNCSIISAREELQIILRKSDLNSQFKTPIYPKKYLIFKCPKLQVTNLPNGNLNPGASDFKPRVGTFVNHPPENKKIT